MTTPDNTEASPLARVQDLAADTLSDEDLSRLATWARLTEPQRRREEARAAESAASTTMDLVSQLWAVQPALKPAFSDTPEGEVPEWVAPGSDFTAYPPQAHVSWVGRVWRNDLTSLNLATPGEDPSWVDVTPIIPDGTRHAPYPWAPGLLLEGGQIVQHEGQLFIASQDHTTTEQAPDQLVGELYERLV